MSAPLSRGGRVSSRGIGHFDDNYGYDARRDAYQKYMSNPGRYTASQNSMNGRFEDTYGNNSRNRHVTVVIEHRSGCTGQSVCDDLKDSIKYNFRDVRVKEIRSGRLGSFEVFINGKLLYSKITQGGYPYEDEVLDAVDRATNGEEFHELDRGSHVCTIL